MERMMREGMTIMKMGCKIEGDGLVGSEPDGESRNVESSGSGNHVKPSAFLVPKRVRFLTVNPR